MNYIYVIIIGLILIVAVVAGLSLRPEDIASSEIVPPDRDELLNQNLGVR